MPQSPADYEAAFRALMAAHPGQVTYVNGIPMDMRGGTYQVNQPTLDAQLYDNFAQNYAARGRGNLSFNDYITGNFVRNLPGDAAFPGNTYLGAGRSGPNGPATDSAPATPGKKSLAAGMVGELGPNGQPTSPGGSGSSSFNGGVTNPYTSGPSMFTGGKWVPINAQNPDPNVGAVPMPKNDGPAWTAGPSYTPINMPPYVPLSPGHPAGSGNPAGGLLGGVPGRQNGPAAGTSPWQPIYGNPTGTGPQQFSGAPWSGGQYSNFTGSYMPATAPHGVANYQYPSTPGGFVPQSSGGNGLNVQPGTTTPPGTTPPGPTDPGGTGSPGSDGGAGAGPAGDGNKSAQAAPNANGTMGYQPRSFADYTQAGITLPFRNNFEQYSLAMAQAQPYMPTFPYAQNPRPQAPGLQLGPGTGGVLPTGGGQYTPATGGNPYSGSSGAAGNPYGGGNMSGLMGLLSGLLGGVGTPNAGR